MRRGAADGIDELLANLPGAGYFRPRVKELQGNGESFALRGTEPAERWLIVLQPSGWGWGRSDGEASLTVTGDTERLLLLLYGRTPMSDARLAVSGDERVLDFWLERTAL
jgi:MDMPI C-terminal domain